MHSKLKINIINTITKQKRESEQKIKTAKMNSELLLKIYLVDGVDVDDVYYYDLLKNILTS